MTQVIPKGFKQTEIGLIPEDWEVASFEDVSEVIGGGTPSTKNQGYFGGDIPWLTPKDLSGYSNKYISKGERNITEEGLKNSSAKLMPKGTVLLTSRAPVGYVAIAENDITTNQGFKSLVCNNEKVNNYFMYYYFKNNKDYLEGHASGSTFKELSGGTLKKLKLPLPPLPQQKAIAEILSSLDDKIELLEKQNKTLENIGQAIFKSWFVDFEGFENDLVESEMGMIPRGWKVYDFKDIVKHLKPGTNYQPKRVTNGIPFINGRHVKGGIIKLDNVQYITEDEYKRVHKAWQPEENDILITRIGTLGNVGVIKKSDLPLAVHYNNINIKADKLSFQFIYFLLQSEVFTYYYHLRKKQAVQEYITIEDVEGIPIVLPINFEEIKNIEDSLKDNYDKIKNNNLQIQTLSNLRDSLLPRLMNGKVRVKI